MISDSREAPPDRQDSDDLGEDTQYLEAFIAGDVPDIHSLFANAPAANEEIRALAEIAMIRTAYGEVFREVEAQIRAQEDESGGAGEGPEPAVAPSQFGGYRLVELLGAGGFAKVWRARDERTERDVALKILPDRRELPPEVVLRFLREARALARMNHANIVRIHHVIEERQALGLCMELIAGETLRSYLERRGKLSADETALIGIDVANALAEVHRAGFVHRDVKVENIMREDTGRVILMDFGITRALESESRVTATGVLIGTPVVMAPEQYEFQEADQRTDVYAVGCLLYRLLAGRPPIIGETVEEIRQRALDADYPPLRDLRPDLPAGFDAIVHKAMHRRREKRFSSASELEGALRSWLDSYSRTLERPNPRTIVVPSLVAGLLLVIAVLVVLLLQR